MRKLTLSLAAFALMVPGTAMACHHGHASSVSVNCEQGVRVYRAAPLAAPAIPRVIVRQADNRLSQERAALQSERLSAQSERIDALESRLQNNQRQTRRRGFSAPVGAFGAAPFVRRRGFKNRRNNGIRVRFDRRIRS